MPLVLDLRPGDRRDDRRLGNADRSGRLGAAGTIVAAALYRSLTFANLMKALTGTVAVSGTILFIIIGATTFSQVLSFSGVVNGLVELVTGLGLSVNALMIAMLLILLFLGCFVDQVSMMLITLPFFMPLVQRYDVDLIWFGVLFLICMQLGLLTAAVRPAAVHDEGGGAALDHHARRSTRPRCLTSR